MMKKLYSVNNEQDGQIIELDELPTGELFPTELKKHKTTFTGGSELVPLANEEWKIIKHTGEEIFLPKNKKWIITFKNHSDIFITSLPYKRLEKGEWIILLTYYSFAYYTEKDKLKRHNTEYLDLAKWQEKQRRKIIKGYEKAEKRRDARDNDGDDEENIMRGLRSGNGDKFGF